MCNERGGAQVKDANNAHCLPTNNLLYTLAIADTATNGALMDAEVEQLFSSTCLLYIVYGNATSCSHNPTRNFSQFYYIAMRMEELLVEHTFDRLIVYQM